MLPTRLARHLTTPRAGPSSLARSLHATRTRLDLDRSSTSTSKPRGEDIPARLIGTREEIERKKNEAREKYKEQLDRRMKEENVSSLEELRARIALTTKKAEAKSESTTGASSSETRVGAGSTTTAASGATAAKRKESGAKDAQVNNDRAGIKPLSQILNLPLIYSSPHTTPQISSLWHAYHSAHPTLSPTFLSASIPPSTYAHMVQLAKQHPVFLLPLPRETEAGKTTGAEAPSWEMFFLQWTFHPTPSVNAQDLKDGLRGVERQPASSVMLTSLEEYKQNGEWARPWLVLTHYPDLHNNPIGNPSPPLPRTDPGSGKTLVDIRPDAEAQQHPVILMRGEISPSSSKSPVSSPLPSMDLSLTQAEAQLLALGLQRFYCSTVKVEGESEKAAGERKERETLLRSFGAEGWDWKGLVRMAFGGMV